MVELKRLTPGHPDLDEISKINDEAFPENEWMSLDAMFQFAASTASEILGIYQGSQPLGFTMIVKNSQSAYVFFLAVGQNSRGKGIGGEALRALFARYPEHQIVLDFEELDPAAENYQQRVRRKAFYLRNGFHETGRFTLLRGNRFEVVCNQGALNAESFLDLVKLIHTQIPEFPGILI